MSDRERLKLFNKLCKTCSRHRVIPKSMHIPDCSKDSVEVECGGYANVSQSTYEGRQVAIKAVRVYITSDLDVILSVSLLPTPSCLCRWVHRRDFVERGSHGSTSNIQTSISKTGELLWDAVVAVVTVVTVQHRSPQSHPPRPHSYHSYHSSCSQHYRSSGISLLSCCGAHGYATG